VSLTDRAQIARHLDPAIAAARRALASRTPPRDSIPLRSGMPEALATLHPVSAIALVLSALLVAVYFLDVPLYHHSRTLTPEARALMARITDLGLGGWKMALALGVGLFFLWRAKQAARPRNAVRARHRAGLAFFVLAAVVYAGVTASVVKHMIGRARPSVEGIEGVLTFQPLGIQASYASFPSGHSATIFAAGIALAMIFPRLRIALLALAVWVALSRVLLGVHWFSDTLGSLVLSLSFVWVLRQRWAARRWGFVWRHGRFDARRPRADAGQAGG